MTKRNSNTYCSVYGCKTFYTQEGNISFHKFPNENKVKVKWINLHGVEEMVDRRKAWIMKLRMDKTNLKKTQLKVCSKHFKKEDFILPEYKIKNASLKNTAVPSQNLPETSIKCRTPKKRKSPKKRESPLILTSNKTLSKNIVVESIDYSTNLSSTCEHYQSNNANSESYENSFQAVKTRCAVSNCGIQTEAPTSTVDIGVQVATGDIFIPFISLVDTPQKLNTMTGIPSYEILEKIVELFTIHFPNTKSYRLSIKERILLVFIKFKQNLSFIVLSIICKSITAETCRVIYNSTIPLLAHILKALIYWPTKKETLANMPLCFENFIDTAVILDCTEIFVQAPKCLACRIRLYSNYKSTYTLKFMIGITPGGLISFVSNPYGGRASDKVIFEQSGIIHNMSSLDAVMVDKGFLIDTICNSHNIKLIRPPFLRNKSQFSKEEAILTKDIAKARVHIERVNQRLKTFKIFHNKFPWSHAHMVSDIMTIICGICNLSVPIFANDKFIS